MNGIVGESTVSCALDAAAILLMAMLFLLSDPLRLRRTPAMRRFFRFSLVVVLFCAASLTCSLLLRRTAPWTHTAALGARTLREGLVTVAALMWNAYIYARLFGEGKALLRKNRLFLLPAAVIILLLLINLFTGILFTVGPDNRMEQRPAYYVLFGVDLLYFIISLILVRMYDVKTEKARFLRVPSMIMFILLAALPRFLPRYDAGALGLAAGVYLTYFSMIDEFRYLDEESGLYNRGYLACLLDMAVSGKNDVRFALLLEAEGDLNACFRILGEVLHRDVDVIRLEERVFVLFSNTDNKAVMPYLASLAEEAAEQHNREHPEKRLHFTTRYCARQKGEDAFSFLRTVMERKQSGDSMRGIVSMMSELDRLDKELELAAKIQANSLPAVFPAFPERREFDLFASMTPAKEVGGDFYDFFLVDDDHLALVIADVSGKGVPAALFMMIAKSLLKNQLLGGCAPEEALHRTNLQLCENNPSMTFVTVWLALLELSTGKGLACNAGHENPGLRRAGGPFELLKYKHDLMVGVRKKAQYHAHEFTLRPGDCLFVYTDGVPEAANADHAMFGGERLLETLNQEADADPRTLIQRVHEAADRFAGGAPQFDDITMLCLKYRGQGA